MKTLSRSPYRSKEPSTALNWFLLLKSSISWNFIKHFHICLGGWVVSMFGCSAQGLGFDSHSLLAKFYQKGKLISLIRSKPQAEKPWMIEPWSYMDLLCMIKVQSFMVSLPEAAALTAWRQNSGFDPEIIYDSCPLELSTKVQECVNPTWPQREDLSMNPEGREARGRSLMDPPSEDM